MATHIANASDVSRRLADEDGDDLRAARGFAVGMILTTIAWLLIGGVGYLIYAMG